MRKFPLLIVGTALGGFISVLYQFQFDLSPILTEDLLMLAIVLVFALIFVLVLFPLQVLVEKNTSSNISFVVMLFAAVILSIGLGFIIYIGFLHRPLGLLMKRELPYLLSFSLMGLGYAFTYLFNKRI